MRAAFRGRRQAMSSKPDDPDDDPDALASLDPITREAIAWLVRTRSGTQTEQDHLAYEAWKARDSEHHAAAERAERLWEMIGPAFDGKAPTAVKGKGPGRGPGRLPVVVLALVGSAAALFAAGLFGPPASFFADETTGVGERRSVVLADGSRVDLDTRTSFDVAEGGRRLTLHAGQVFVTVASDPTRPFVVQSGDGHVEALGTAFDVRRDEARTTVAVAESAVRVTAPASGASVSAVDVAAGQETSYALGAGTAAPQPADLRARTAWRLGELRFDGRPLGEVMDELGRYRRGVVVFTDESLRRLPVTGVFRVKNVDSVMNAVALLAPVSMWRLPWITVIQRGAGRAPSPR